MVVSWSLLKSFLMSDQCCGSGAFLTPGSGMEKIRVLDLGSAINITGHISKSLEIIIWVEKKLNSLLRIRIHDPVPF
jgi:hypothetical protein